MSKKIGVILNGHRPPHNGHVYMVEFAQAYVDELHLGVCTLSSESISEHLRYKWTKELFPNTHVTLCHNMPQLYNMDYDNPALWERVVKDFMGLKHVDYIFASEGYGHTIGKAIGAKYIPVDHSRCTIPVSASMIRENPMLNWDYIPPVVRPFFVKRVCIIGAEYTGKADLAYRLASRYNTIAVDEYAKTVYNSEERTYTLEDIELIARGQMAAEDSLAKQANKVLICNTDLLTTTFWSNERFQTCPDWVLKEAEKRDYDLYLFMDHVGVPHTSSNTHSIPESWYSFSKKILKGVQDLGRNYIMLSGNPMNRMQVACMAIDKLMSLTPGVSDKMSKRWTNG